MAYNKRNYQKNTNLISKSAPVASPGVTRVKTDGRIGSVTPPAYLKGGAANVDNNTKAGPPGKLGSQAAKHMSPDHSGEHWAPRVAKSRKMAAGGDAGREHTNPINRAVKGLRPLLPK